MSNSLIIEELSSKQKLERDRALQKLKNDLEKFNSEEVNSLLSSFLTVIRDSSQSWESYHGILSAIKGILINADCIDEHFLHEFCVASLHLLTHNEVRVRISAGEVLGALCHKNGGVTYTASKTKILELIYSNLERSHPTDEELTQHWDSENPIERLSLKTRERRNSDDAAQIFHDTAGWRNLETSMKCLEELISGCGKHFLPHIDQELLELIFTSLSHTNRFVRETGYAVCGALVTCSTSDEEPLDENPIVSFGEIISSHLARGMADNWSQVRMAASVATRKFLTSLPVGIRERYYSTLLPKICLNRYYVAEGVRLYSQETWRQVAGTEGRLLVEKFIDSVVAYYIEATEANNHAVREAACACIAELALKIPHAAVQPYVTKLLNALKICFHDDSWPVRDAACLASANFISCFPDESLEDAAALLPLFFNNLQDNIPSVRQGAATALATLVKTYGDKSQEEVLGWIKNALKGVKDQPCESAKYSELETGLSTYGVVKKKRDNDLELHSNQQMYSCGSLAPKMGRGGCSDCRFKRPTELWEKADGAIYLLAELSSIPLASKNVAELLPLVATSCGLRHYTAHYSLLETLCKTLPVIARGIGKRAFKEKLSLFFDSVFYALESENALSSSAASQCLNQISQFLGPNILRGRVSEYNPSYLKALDANSFIAPF